MARSAGRSGQIVRVSIIGIAANALLAGFKAAVGLISNSIAIVLDAVNNLSDALSSVITIIGTKLAGRQPDKEHPFGYGRIEYISAVIIAAIVLYAGITSLTESVQRIITPETADYSAVTLIIVAVAVVVKIVLGRYVKSRGEALNSDSLVNSGTDAIMDSVISASTLVAAFIYIFTGISLEAWLGAIIAIVIIKAGVDMLRETLAKMLGSRVGAEVAGKVKESVHGVDGVLGVYDLTMTDYGPSTYTGSVHIEVPDTMTAVEIDRLTREITSAVHRDTGVLLTAVGVYAMNTTDDEAVRMRDRVHEIALSHEHVEQVHGFYVDRETRFLNVDVVVGFEEQDARGLIASITDEVQAAYPDYRINVALDRDISG